MDPLTHASSNPLKRTAAGLRDPIWQGIGGIAAILALAAPLAWAAWELLSGNVRLLLWLHATAYAVPLVVAALLLVFLIALCVLTAWRTVADKGYFENRPRLQREPRFSRRGRVAALFVMLVSIALALVITVGYDRWLSTPSQQTVVLIADFLDPDGEDSMMVTRDLVREISDTLADFPIVQVRALGWPISDLRGEGSADARRIGELAKADIVIWGDYRTEGEFVAYVHFDLLVSSAAVIETESYRVFGDEQMQQVAAAQQQLAMPETVAFNIALGEHLGALAAFAGGWALLESGAYTESARLLDAAAQVYGDPLAVHIEPAIHYVRGNAYAFTGDMDVAQKEYTAALVTLGASASLANLLTPSMLLVNRGNARRDQGDLEGAVADFDQAIALDPKLAMAYNNRGLARSDQGDLTGAIADYNQAITLDLKLAAVYYYNRGNASGDQGDLAGAIADYNQAIALDPGYAAAYNNRGLARRDQGDLAGAIADFSQAIALDPEYAAAYNNRGVAHRDQGDLEGAIADFGQAIFLAPEYAVASYSNRGVARHDQGDLAGAIADFGQAIALDPEDAAAYYNRGNASRDHGDLAGAIADFGQAIALDPEYAAAYNNRGIARSDQGDLAGAMADYNQAIALDSEFAAAYYNRGLARLDQNNLAGAITDFTRYLELYPDAPNRADVEQSIADLEAQLGTQEWSLL